MTGTLTVGDTSTSATVATIKSSNASGTYIQFVNGTTPTVEVGYNATYGAYLYNDKLDSHPTLCLGLADNLRDAIIYKYAGVNYNVWHSGSLKPYQFTNWADTRSVNHVPNDYGSLFIMRGIKNLTTIGLSDSGVYATVWGWRGWLDKSGGHAWEIASTNNDLYTRHGETTSWTSWAKILNSSNYKDYMHDRFGTSGLIVYPSLNNEINFGGTYTANSNIYFGYNSKDNRPKPTNYYFGNSDATVHAKSFIAYASSGPHFYGRADANNWAYIRLYSGTIFGDIAVTTNSSASSTAGAIELRPSGTESKKGGVTGEGYLFTQSSGYLTTIGSTNISYCHFYTTAPEYYFNKTTVVNGNITPYVNANFDLGRTDYYWNRVYANAFISKIATGTQPFQCVSTTTCTNLNADMVDGYHSNDLTKRVFINGIPGGAGSKWIRIGVLKYPGASDSNTVMITISNSYSYSRNRSVTFIISLTHHASKPIITQLNGYPAPFTAVRILAPKDSNGSYTYGDRYVDISYSTSTISGASNVIYLTAINLNYNDSYHFVPNKSFVDGSTIPSNYGEIWNFPFATGLGSNANIYSQDGLIEGGTLKLSSTSTFGETATFNGGMYSGNIFPLSNNKYRIGSFGNRFIDAYIQAWVYANSGLYMNPSGITQNGSYLELSSGGNEIIIAGGTDFYVNYRGASYGGRSVPKKWYWHAGSSSSWANMEFGNCTLHGLLNSTGISASGANSFNVGARFSNTSHDSIEIVGGNYTMGLGCHSNGSWFWWRGTANPTISTNKSYVMAYDGSTWAFTGSITATAAITAKATSDFRLKENYDGLIDYRERLLKLGRVYDYNYNKKALDLYQDRIDNKRHTGLVYQNAVKAGITNFCHEKDEYGYGSLNYLSPDLIATIIGSVQANILSIRLVESEQERMRKELEHAKSEINRLKGLVASLQN